MLSFPAHTTHRLQPLDKSVFKSLKTYYNEVSSSWIKKNPRNTIKQTTVSELFGMAYSKSVGMDIALNCFKSTGIWPCDQNKFDNDFLLIENMINCLKCKLWAHVLCAGVDKKTNKYIFVMVALPKFSVRLCVL